MHDFRPITSHLQSEFPGRLTCQPGKRGQANGLDIRCEGRSGSAFLYEPDRDESHYLLTLEEADDDPNPEVWDVQNAAEVVERIGPWAFPNKWTQPPPINLATERKRLQKILKGITAREAPCEIGESRTEFIKLLTEPGRQQFDDDIAAVDTSRVVENFPWDAAGRYALKTVVLLNTYETTEPPGRDRTVCLAAIGPERRRDDQVIRVELIDLIVVNQTHRWDQCRWMWTGDSPPESIWLGSQLHSMDNENKLAVKSLELLDGGDIEGAMRLYGVALSDDLHRLLGSERISPPACCAHPDERWTNLLVDTLRQAAPWRLPDAAQLESNRLTNWAAAKKGRRRRAPMLKLVIFPGQHHSRKASLMLTSDIDGGHPRFEIEATASNARLHDTGWKRPLHVDLARRDLNSDSA